MKIAVHGLGRMGMQIARKLTESGQHTVIAHNRSPEPVQELEAIGAIGAYSTEAVVDAFAGEQAIVWVMLPSEITDQVVLEWATMLPAGSIIINGGNSNYKQTIALSKQVADKRHTLIDVGVSGGIWGYDNGFPLMCGSDSVEAFAVLEPVLQTLVQPGGAYHHFGPSGSGHYVKMVHNAIEYGMMQSLGEGFRLLKEGPYPALDLAAAADVWQHNSVITSWLTELSRQALVDSPELEGISGYVAESGEAKWALETASEMGYTVPAIQAAFDVRLASQQGETNFATKIVAAQRNKFGGHNLNGEGKA